MMFGSRQAFLPDQTADDVAKHLEGGARVVWMTRHEFLFDLVIDTELPVDVSPADIVQEFLENVSAQLLEKKMLEDEYIDLTPGQAALKVLSDMVR